MQTPETRLTQYRVLSDHRLHFGRLFFQVIAFDTALAAALHISAESDASGVRAALPGAILLATAFIAFRLMRQEAIYSGLMRDFEAVMPGWVQTPPPAGLGSRLMTVCGLATVGVSALVSAWIS